MEKDLVEGELHLENVELHVRVQNINFDRVKDMFYVTSSVDIKGKYAFISGYISQENFREIMEHRIRDCQSLLTDMIFICEYDYEVRNVDGELKEYPSYFLTEIREVKNDS